MLFHKDEVLHRLNGLLKISELEESSPDLYWIDKEHQFGFDIEENGFTIYLLGEHFHFRNFGDPEVSREMIFDEFHTFLKRLLKKPIDIIYTIKGRIVTKVMITGHDNREDIIANYLCSLNPLALLYKPKYHVETVELKQR